MADERMGEMFAQDRLPDEGKLIGFGDDPPMSPKDFLRTWRPYLRDYKIGIGAQADPARFRAALPGMPPSENIEDRRNAFPIGAEGLLYNVMAGRRSDERYFRTPDNPPSPRGLARAAGYFDVYRSGR
jgi:hypothetical protein